MPSLVCSMSEAGHQGIPVTLNPITMPARQLARRASSSRYGRYPKIPAPSVALRSPIKLADLVTRK